MYDTYRDRGLMIISVLSVSAVEQLQEWADSYSLSYAVVMDDGDVGYRYEDDGYIPSFSLLAPGAEIIILDGAISAAQIEEQLPW